MHVFVLCTGRCGSMTLARACAHITNFTSGHESNRGLSPSVHLSYPNQHIEIDNRLSWFLGRLNEIYPDAYYVHLTRDPEQVARSYVKRWPADPPYFSPYRRPIRRLKDTLNPWWRPGMKPGHGITPAFAYPMMARNKAWPELERLEVSRYYVSTVTANIEHFLDGKSHHRIRLESASRDFISFWKGVGAQGDLERALAEFSVRHNKS